MKYFLCFLLGLASCAGAADLKIGVVDSNRILRDSGPAQRASRKLDREFEARKVALQRLTNQSKALELQLDKGVLPDAERRAKERELVKLTQDIDRMQRELNEDMNLRRNEEMSALQERAKQAVRQVAEAERFDLIVQDQDVVYRHPRLDITDKVIRRLALEK
jgi:outer membrane protein